jgi:hypothetical protein
MAARSWEKIQQRMPTRLVGILKKGRILLEPSASQHSPVTGSSCAYLMKKNVSTEKAPLLIDWNRKSFSTSCRNALLSATQRTELLYSVGSETEPQTYRPGIWQYVAWSELLHVSGGRWQISMKQTMEMSSPTYTSILTLGLRPFYCSFGDTQRFSVRMTAVRIVWSRCYFTSNLFHFNYTIWLAFSSLEDIAQYTWESGILVILEYRYFLLMAFKVIILFYFKLFSF